MVIYLEVDEVEYIHQVALDLYGGFPGREPGNLEAKLMIPCSGFGDFEKYPTIFDKAGAYLFFLASGHCFKDGNKRTAYMSTSAFLDLNGYDLIASDEEVYDFVSLVANDKTRPPIEYVIEWIKQHAQKQV